jgi:hypothetical protein
MDIAYGYCVQISRMDIAYIYRVWISCTDIVHAVKPILYLYSRSTRGFPESLSLLDVTLRLLDPENEGARCFETSGTTDGRLE